MNCLSVLTKNALFEARFYGLRKTSVNSGPLNLSEGCIDKVSKIQVRQVVAMT